MGNRRRDLLRAFLVMVIFGVLFLSFHHWRQRKMALPAQNKKVLSLTEIAGLNATTNPHHLEDEDEKPKPSTSATSTLEKPLTTAQIEEALNGDNICLIFRHFDSQMSEMLKVMSEQIHSPSLRKIFEIKQAGQDGEVNDGSEILLFYNALLQANLLEALSVPQPDYLYSSQVFEALYANDSQNGAYAYYKAETLAALNAPLEEQKRWLVLALKAPYFHTFLKPTGEEIQKDLIRNATTWFLSDYLLAEIPMPKPPFALIKKLFPDPTTEEANMILDFGLQLNEDEQSMAVEYAIAKALVDRNWDKAGGKSPKPNLRNLDTNESRRNFDQAEEIMMRLGSGNCNRAPVDEAYESAKAAGFRWE